MASKSKSRRMSPPTLAWTVEAELYEWHVAANTAGIASDDRSPAEFRVTELEDGRYDVNDSDHVLLDGSGYEGEDLWMTADAAKSWCEARNAELVAIAASAPTRSA